MGLPNDPTGQFGTTGNSGGAAVSSTGSALLGGIGGALPVIGSVVNALTQNAANKKAQQFALQQYQRQRNDALADWRMQNEYNSPSAQMERLKAAGLNPNLVYGNGATATSEAMPRSSQAQSWSPHAPQVDLSGIGQGLMLGIDAKIKQAQSDNLAVQNQLMQQDRANKIAELAKTNAETDNVLAGTNLKQKDLDWYDTLKQYQLTAMAAGINKTYADTQMSLDENQRRQAMLAPNLETAVTNIAKMKADTMLSFAHRQEVYQRIENLKKTGQLQDIEINWNQKGITKGDPAYLRLISTLVDKLTGGKGIDVNDQDGSLFGNSPSLDKKRHGLGN